jgi:hypothetical protein
MQIVVALAKLPGKQRFSKRIHYLGEYGAKENCEFREKEGPQSDERV